MQNDQKNQKNVKSEEKTAKKDYNVKNQQNSSTGKAQQKKGN